MPVAHELGAFDTGGMFHQDDEMAKCSNLF
jgi:hypothetical protein